MTAIASQVRTAIYDIVDALSSVGSVYKYEETHPNRWPAVYITQADMEGTFVTTAENRRIYGFNVVVAMPTGQNLPKDGSKDRIEYAEDVCNEVLDQIIGAVDDRLDLDNDVVLFTEAADSQWGFLDSVSGKPRAVQILLRVHTDYQLPNSAFLSDEQGQPLVEE